MKITCLRRELLLQKHERARYWHCASAPVLAQRLPEGCIDRLRTPAQHLNGQLDLQQACARPAGHARKRVSHLLSTQAQSTPDGFRTATAW